MLNKLKENILFLGLSFKKEMMLFFFINMILSFIIFVLIYLKVQMMVIIISVSFIPFIDYLYLSRYRDMVKKLEEERNQEFVSLISYFEIFISNKNNVYKSFELLIPYSSIWMKERIEALLNEIDQDKSVAPFINFAKNFTYIVIQNVMISIFQMIEQGENEFSLSQFDYLFASLNDALYQERIVRKEKSLDILNAFPLFGAGAITIILTFSIMTILGDITNVI